MKIDSKGYGKLPKNVVYERKSEEGKIVIANVVEEDEKIPMKEMSFDRILLVPDGKDVKLVEVWKEDER